MINKEIFVEYVNSFGLSLDIEKVLEHSLRVSKLARRIAVSLNLDDDIVDLTEFIGLVHDIGRFSQWKKYKTFIDSKSIDHALSGVIVLFEQNLIQKFNIYPDAYDAIKKAIFYHNKYAIPSEIDGIALVLSKIIRDADKLDLLYVLANSIDAIEEDDSIISKEVSENFLNKKPIVRNKCLTKSDNVIFKMAFVFDLNYEESFKILIDYNLLEKFYFNLRYLEKYKFYYEFLKKFVEEKIK